MALALDTQACTTCTVNTARYPQHTASIAGYPMLKVIPRHETLNESEVEAMTKGKALLLSIVCAASAIACFAYQEVIGMWAFASGAILFLSIWLYKYLRDRHI